MFISEHLFPSPFLCIKTRRFGQHCMILLSRNLFQVTFTCSKSTTETLEKLWNMFKVNNKNTRMTSLTYFTTFSSVSVVDFEQVNVSWVLNDILIVADKDLYWNYNRKIQYIKINSDVKTWKKLISKLLGFNTISWTNSYSNSTTTTLEQSLVPPFQCVAFRRSWLSNLSSWTSNFPKKSYLRFLTGFQKQGRWRCSVKKCVLRNFPKFTGARVSFLKKLQGLHWTKHLWWLLLIVTIYDDKEIQGYIFIKLYTKNIYLYQK